MYIKNENLYKELLEKNVKKITIYFIDGELNVVEVEDISKQ